MPFPRQKSFKTLGLSLCLAAALLCSLAVNLTAQEPPAQANKRSHNNDREKSEAQPDPNHMIRAPKNPRFFGALPRKPLFPSPGSKGSPQNFMTVAEWKPELWNMLLEKQIDWRTRSPS
jgi:hypothetical protein